MLREVVSGAGDSLPAIVGLIVFFIVFVGVCLWVFTRRRGTVDRWAGLPLDGDSKTPREPRGTHSAQARNER
jgi:cbb3-type cytochrome oxidase subunit 3